MKFRNVKLNFTNKLAVAFVLSLVYILVFPSTVFADSRDDLLGVWRGTYINTRGLNGYEFLVFRDGADYRAVVHFFPVEGSPADQIPAGSTLNEVLFDASTGRFYFDTLMWLHRPEGINAVGQTGILVGDTFSGHLQGNPLLTFDVMRVERSNFQLNLAHDHIAGSSSAEILAATCYSEGVRVYDCIFCGIEMERTISPSLEHSPSGNWIVLEAATCLTEGDRVQNCATCDIEVLREVIPYLPHSLSDSWTILENSTCTSEGIRIQHCTVCDAEVLQESILLLPHTPDGNWVIYEEPMCNVPGRHVQYCVSCNSIAIDEVIPPITGSDHVLAHERISGNIFIPPITTELICEICDYYSETNMSYAFAWVSPAIVVAITVVAFPTFKKIKRGKKSADVFCGNCGKPITKDALFCGECGHKAAVSALKRR